MIDPRATGPLPFTAVSPHTLTFALTVRPIVFSPQQDIVLSIVRGPAEMRVDGGRRGRAVATGDTLRCSPHPRRLKVIRFGPPEDFYRRLGDKLGWGRPLVPMK